MAEPKRKTSKMKKRMRQGAQKHAYANASACPKCGASKLAHRVCPSCGSYNGRQVMVVTVDE